MSSTQDKLLKKDTISKLLNQSYKTTGSKKKKPKLVKKPTTTQSSATDNKTKKPFKPVGTPVQSNAQPSEKELNLRIKLKDYAAWASRENSNEVLLTYGTEQGDISSNGSVAIEQIGGIPSNTTTQANSDRTQHTYMYDKLSSRGEIHTDQVIEFGAKIIEHYNLDYAQPFDTEDDSELLYVGRVLIDTQDGGGKLIKNSILLEGLADAETSNSRIVRLQLGDVRTTVFPGQVVAVKGVKQTIGTKESVKYAIQASEIYTGIPPNVVPIPNTAKLNLIAAAGPFTAYNDLSFEPLTDLLKVAENAKAELVVLMGPFIDVSHPMIEEEEHLDYTFDEIFEREVLVKLQRYLNSNPTSKVVLVPSLKDVHHDFVFPQPAFNKKDWGDRFKDILSRIYCVSNPSTFSVNGGVTIGVTSNDTLTQLSQKEFSNQMGVDLIKRRVEAFITQHSFHPILVASEAVPLDWSHCSKLSLVNEEDVAPSILLLPSSMKHFCQVVQGILVINPQFLYDKTVGSGSYAHVVIGTPVPRTDIEGDTEMSDVPQVKVEPQEQTEEQNGDADEMTDLDETKVKTEVKTEADLTQRIHVKILRL